MKPACRCCDGYHYCLGPYDSKAAAEDAANKLGPLLTTELSSVVKGVTFFPLLDVDEFVAKPIVLRHRKPLQ